MASLKQKGDLAELKVAADLIERGCKLSIPFGEDCDYDLIADYEGRLHRVQVKFTESDGSRILIRCRSPFANERQGQTDEALHRGDDRLDCGLRPHERPLLLLPV
jgi:PD-(D/E)XK endonuclease